MATKPTKKSPGGKGKRSETSLDQLSEKDLEIPEGYAENVKGGVSICGKGRPPNPRLVPIPTKPIR